jgi:hypothetical protein
MVGFVMEHLRVGGGSGTAFAEADIIIGPFRLHAQLDAHGNLTIDHALRDQALRAAIGTAMRKAVLAQMTRNWARLDAEEQGRIVIEGSAVPQAQPDYERAIILLRRVYNEFGAGPEVKALLRHYNASRFSEIPRTEGPALLKAARALAARFSVSAADLA